MEASKQNLEKAVLQHWKSEVMQHLMQGNTEIRTGYCLSFRKTSICELAHRGEAARPRATHTHQGSALEFKVTLGQKC